MRITIDVTEASAAITEVSGEQPAQVMAPPDQGVGTKPSSSVALDGGVAAFAEAEVTTTREARPPATGGAFDGGAAAFSQTPEITAPAAGPPAADDAFDGGAAPD